MASWDRWDRGPAGCNNINRLGVKLYEIRMKQLMHYYYRMRLPDTNTNS